MMIGRCPRCRTEYPLKVVGFYCGRCLVEDNRAVCIVLAPPMPKILPFPKPETDPPAKKGA
jgi:hypothetical protein